MGKRRTVEVQSLDKVPVGAKFSPQTLATVSIAPIPASQPPVLVAGYDSRDGSLRLLNLRNFAEMLAVQEKVYALDRIDARNGVEVTVENGTGVGDTVTGAIEVPAGEVWYINRLAVTCPAADADGSASFNIRVSSWPNNRTYFAVAQVAMGAVTNIDLPAQGELGEELRLVGGDTLTLTLVGTVAFTVDKDFRLDLFGRKGRPLVP